MTKYPIKRIMPLFAGIALLGAIASAQIVVSNGSTYNQDFNTPDFAAEVASASTGVAAWSYAHADNNVLYPGWTRQVDGGAGNVNRDDKDFIGQALNGNTARFGNVGSAPAGDAGAYPQPSTDRALISLIRGANEISFGVVFQVSGAAVSGVNVSYQGEQWFRALNANTLEFQYKILSSYNPSTFLINDETGWTDFNALDFTALKTGAGQTINGNYSGAEFGPNNATLSGSISLAASDGQYIAFRWRQVDQFGGIAQSGLGVDDFSATFVPEPSTYALLVGLATLGLVIRRRRG
jgi:hypothetical protein